MRYQNRTYAKDAMLMEYQPEHAPVIFKVKQLKAAQNPKPKSPPHSPDTIFSALAGVLPPTIKLPKTKAEASSPWDASARLLPVNAVWGGGRKVWVSPREQEILDHWLDEVLMTSRAQLPSKTHTVWSDKARVDKLKHASLTTKYWVKQRAEKRVLLAHDDRMHVDDKLRRIGEEHDGDDGLFSLGEHNFKPPRKHAERRARVRRAARRSARDSKCFSWDDAVEAEAVRTEVAAQLEQEATKRKQRQQQQRGGTAAPIAVRLRDGTLRYPDEVIETLLMCYVVCCEPRGQPLAALRGGGVALSMAATADLEDMLRVLPKMGGGGLRKRSSATGKDDALLRSGSPTKARARKKSRSGTKQLLVAPKMVNAYAGKRGC